MSSQFLNGIVSSGEDNSAIKSWYLHSKYPYQRGLALQSRVLVIGSREKEEKNLQIAFRCMEAMQISSLYYW